MYKYMDMYLQAIDNTENIGKFLAIYYKAVASAKVANESQRYYTIANEGVIEAIKNVVKAIFDFIVNLIKKLIDFIHSIFKKIADLFDFRKREDDKIRININESLNKMVDNYNDSVDKFNKKVREIHTKNEAQSSNIEYIFSVKVLKKEDLKRLDPDNAINKEILNTTKKVAVQKITDVSNIVGVAISQNYIKDAVDQAIRNIRADANINSFSNKNSLLAFKAKYLVERSEFAQEASNFSKKCDDYYSKMLLQMKNILGTGISNYAHHYNSIKDNEDENAEALRAERLKELNNIKENSSKLIKAVSTMSSVAFSLLKVEFFHGHKLYQSTDRASLNRKLNEVCTTIEEKLSSTILEKHQENIQKYSAY